MGGWVGWAAECESSGTNIHAIIPQFHGGSFSAAPLRADQMKLATKTITGDE